MTKYASLFEPGYMGKLKVKNRLVKAPMWTGYAARDGSVTPRMLNYYKEAAIGGTGLIIVEYAYTDDQGSQSQPCQLGIYDRSLIPGLSQLARTIKDNGSAAGIQICHCGRRRRIGKPPILAPSKMPWQLWGEEIIPDELTIEQIRGIVKSHGDAARIAEQAGYDMIEVHAGHGYLLTQFLSPYTNRRADSYGGELADRMRILIEIIQDMRRKVSPGFPISVRLSISDYMKTQAITIEDSLTVCRELEKAGTDVIHASSGDMATWSSVAPMNRPAGFNVPFAEQVKKVVRVPVMVGGALGNPDLAEKVIAEGKADFISMARPTLADPWFARKAEEGRPEDIAPCIRCNDGCLSRGMTLDRGVGCTVNFTAGIEGEWPIRTVEKARKIAVVGGGPGGMEAARVAALRGHKVTLYESRERLGGALLEAAIPEFKSELRRLTAYLDTQLNKLGVNVLLNTEAKPAALKQQKYDAIILAAGGKPLMPAIRGLEKRAVIAATDALEKVPAGKNIVVAGGGLVGCEVALYLAQQGKKVCIIEQLPDIAAGVEGETRKVLVDDLARFDVQGSPGLRLEEITERGVAAIDVNGRRQTFPADVVVIALGFEPNNRLQPKLEQSGVPVFTVGDCVSPRRILDAMHEGFLAGYRV